MFFKSQRLSLTLFALVALGDSAQTLFAEPSAQSGSIKAGTMDERYAWGQVVCDGIALGLRVEGQKVPPGGPISYWLAVANRSTQEKKIVLFYTLDDRYRTRLTITPSDPTLATFEPAVEAPGVSSPYRIAVTLAAGEVHEREGIPARLKPALRGKLKLQFEYGGNKAMPCGVKSGIVFIEIQNP